MVGKKREETKGRREIESKDRGKHLRIEGSEGEGLRLGVREDTPG